MSSKLTTHILDTSMGIPASGVRVVLYSLSSSGDRRELSSQTTNIDGRTDVPLLTSLEIGDYEIDFHIGSYYESTSTDTFLSIVSVRFHLDSSAMNYHIPLLVSPYGYSTYRGS